jgi:hypothetical protein
MGHAACLVLTASSLQRVVQRHKCVCCNSPHVSNVHVAERHAQAFYAVQACDAVQVCDALQVGDAERSACLKAPPAACCSDYQQPLLALAAKATGECTRSIALLRGCPLHQLVALQYAAEQSDKD